MTNEYKPEIGKAVFVNLLLSGTQIAKVLDIQENVISIIYSSGQFDRVESSRLKPFSVEKIGMKWKDI